MRHLFSISLLVAGAGLGGIAATELRTPPAPVVIVPPVLQPRDVMDPRSAITIRAHEDGFVDVDADGVPTSLVLAMLSEHAKLPILVEGSAQAERPVWVHLSRVHWAHALAAVSNAADLGTERRGNRIRIAPAAMLRAEKQDRDENWGCKMVEPTILRLMHVEHPDELARLKDITTWPRLRLARVDEEQLLVEATRDHLEEIEQLLHAMEARTLFPLWNVVQLPREAPAELPACPSMELDFRTVSTGEPLHNATSGSVLMAMARATSTNLVVDCFGHRRLTGDFKRASIDDVVGLAHLQRHDVFSRMRNAPGAIPVVTDSAWNHRHQRDEEPQPRAWEHVLFIPTDAADARAVTLEQLGLGSVVALPKIRFVAVRGNWDTLHGAWMTVQRLDGSNLGEMPGPPRDE